VRHSVALQQNAPQARKSSPAKPGAKTGQKTGAKHPGQSPAGSKTPQGTLHARTQRRKQRDEEPPPDPATMYKTGTVRRGHRPALAPARSPAPLKGSHEILVHQNLMADEAGLERIQDSDDLARLRESHELVELPEGRTLHVNPELPVDRRCARPWTVKFAQDTARAFYARFGQPLMVTSAARSVEFQTQLQMVNGNAAGIDGDAASPHLTGQAIDLAKHGMSRAQLGWMRNRLQPLIRAGEIDVEEEFKQACFHISVYRSYLPPAIKHVPQHEVAQLGVVTGTATGTKLKPAPAEGSDAQQ